MVKKRPTLDAFLNSQAETEETVEVPPVLNSSSIKKTGKLTSDTRTVKKKDSRKETSAGSNINKHEIIRHMLYIPLPVYDQLQGLIFEEQRGQAKRRKTHDYLLDAIDLLFREKGLKSISELIGKDR